MEEAWKVPPPGYTENIGFVNIEQPDVGVQAQVTGSDFVLPISKYYQSSNNYLPSRRRAYRH